MARPVIGWLTDFGTRDHYVAAMKAVALGICPDATLVDITHDVAPQDVIGGALELAAVYRYFPAGTVFVAVVDPGVGSARRALAARAGGFTFVGPDNGVFSLALDDGWGGEVVELTNPRYLRREVSRTFEGRDRFAPAAAHLAAGVPLSALGDAVDATTIVRLAVPDPVVEGDALVGEVMRVDRFGNLVTNVTAAAVSALPGDGALVAAVPAHPDVALVPTYADVPAGATCAVIGSTGHVEIAVRGGSAAAALGAGRGVRVRVSRRA